jgi:hypothetical protein
MTLVTDDAPRPPGRAGHPGELRLRRYRAGELDDPAAAEIAEHLPSCAACRARLEALADEQRAFEHTMPFDRFAGGVERARRVPRPRPRRRWVLAAAPLLAAAGALLILGRPQDGAPGGPNRTKGAASEATIRVGRADGSAQRIARPDRIEALGPGERLRIGYRAAGARHLVALSVDDAGEVTPLYPEAGRSLALPRAAETRYLPGGLELTGAGRERVFVFVGEAPLEVEAAAAALRAAYAAARGELTMMAPRLPAAAAPDTFSWTFQKP